MPFPGLSNVIPTRDIKIVRELANTQAHRAIEDRLTAWKNEGSSKWSCLYKQNTNADSIEPGRVWIGTPGRKENLLERVDETADLTRARQWCWDAVNERVWIYSSVNPAKLDIRVWMKIQLIMYNVRNRKGNTADVYVATHTTQPSATECALLAADRETGWIPYAKPEDIYWAASAANLGKYVEIWLLGI